MLKIVLTLSSLLLLHKMTMSWPITTFLCIMLSLIIASINPIYPFYYMSSKMFSMDNMSLSLMTLTIWISALMIIASYKIKLNKNMNNYFILLIITFMQILIMSFSSSNILMFDSKHH